MLNGFKKFILRGNVVDMAVGVVIGAAFGGVVTALTKDLAHAPDRGAGGQARFFYARFSRSVALHFRSGTSSMPASFS